MNRKTREKVYSKYNGHCSYCGKKILYKEMQVDHFIPQNRKISPLPRINLEKYGIPIDDINSLTNLFPSCRRCNHYKRALTVEEYRQQLMTLNDRLEKIYIVKVAIDYGLELKTFNGKFYFEEYLVSPS